MNRIFHGITRPFRAVAAWLPDRGGWLSISLRDHYTVLKALDKVTEGRLTEDQADVELTVYAEWREQNAH